MDRDLILDSMEFLDPLWRISMKIALGDTQLYPIYVPHSRLEKKQPNPEEFRVYLYKGVWVYHTENDLHGMYEFSQDIDIFLREYLYDEESLGKKATCDFWKQLLTDGDGDGDVRLVAQELCQALRDYGDPAVASSAATSSIY